MFDPVSNAWDQSVANLDGNSHGGFGKGGGRKGPCFVLVEISGELYAVGGDAKIEIFEDELGPPATVEKFDPLTNAWIPVPEMALPRGTRDRVIVVRD